MTAVQRPAPSGFVDDFAVVAERFAHAVGRSDMKAPVAACPGWSTLDLVVHLGNVHAWAATVAETGRQAVLLEDRPPSSRPRVVSEWYVAKAEDLYQVLRYRPATAPCWTFVSPSGVTAFWSRRQLHETTVHLMDLDGANGRSTEITGPVAADGVDEVLTVMLVRMLARGHPAALSAPLTLRTTDTGDSWDISPAPSSSGPVPLHLVGAGPPGVATTPPSVQRRRSPADTDPDRPDPSDRVTAPAAVLYRALWHRRVDDAQLEVDGDARRVRAFLDSRLTP
jgi:uncharacterized protein (TIGR03083 family)